MAVAPIVLKTNPHRPVDFKESSVQKVFDESGSVAVEVKEDGCQLNMVVAYEPDASAYVVEFLSREGKAFPGLTELGNMLSHSDLWEKFFEEQYHETTGAPLPTGMFPEGFLLQAEITVDGKTCAEIAGDLRRHEPISMEGLNIIGYDLIPLSAVLSAEEYPVFQEVRRAHVAIQMGRLRAIIQCGVNWDLAVSFMAFDMTHLDLIYEGYRKMGKEGAVAKDPLGHWKRGKKTGQWKVKPDDSCDGTVVGLMWGTPGLANEGKVIGFTVLTEHGVEVEAGGITEAQKDEYTALVNQTRFFTPEANPYQGWACKITYMERLESGSYRHPNFDQFRGITDPMIKE